jgi:UDP-N-acetylglucosamine:LPS N-acetylglucosamine transferase
MTSTSLPAPKKILAVASGGGHWVQLLRLQPAFEGCDVIFVSTIPEYSKDVSAPFHHVTDANIWEKRKLAKMFLEMAWLVLRKRPDVVITTGAAPGLAAVVCGRLFGAKTIWLDSIANSEVLSNSGLLAKRWASVWLTQWPHLSHDSGPVHWGAVL